SLSRQAGQGGPGRVRDVRGGRVHGAGPLAGRGVLCDRGRERGGSSAAGARGVAVARRSRSLSAGPALRAPDQAGAMALSSEFKLLSSGAMMITTRGPHFWSSIEPLGVAQ